MIHTCYGETLFDNSRNEERYQSRKELRNAKEERKKARQSAAIQALNALRDKQNAMMAFNRGPSTAVGRGILVKQISLLVLSLLLFLLIFTDKLRYQS